MNLLIYRVGKKHLLALAVFAMLIIAAPAFAIEIPNPITAGDFPTLIDNIATAVIRIATPLAIIALVIVGFQFVSASATGNAAGIGKAKQAFWWVIIGAAVTVGASALAKAVVEFARTL